MIYKCQKCGKELHSKPECRPFLCADCMLREEDVTKSIDLIEFGSEVEKSDLTDQELQLLLEKAINFQKGMENLTYTSRKFYEEVARYANEQLSSRYSLDYLEGGYLKFKLKSLP